MSGEDGSIESKESIPANVSNASNVASAAGNRIAKDVAAAITASTSTSLAVFLTGALAIQMRNSLHFGAGAFGFAISIYYIGAALGSIPFGRLAEAVGGIRIMRPAALCAAVVLLVVAITVHSWAELVVVLFVAGMLSAQ